ncbi:HORMA domain-containing protein [Stylosanthes scabra]|uniref:HORMA domain-containing protein n=1 Tax=Stylosanthes scabra TaxID=79078 RepID=A0ABU6RC32_9FABA|nr:HORMA domain-containing protein [Stylosanthes scabra]
MDKLVQNGVLSKTGNDTYAINKDKKSEYEFIVKEEIDGQIPQVDRALQDEDLMYMRALYHALPMTYVSATKLQTFLNGEINQTAARKIIDKMTRDGFLEPKGSKRLGKRVIHSELTERKFIEVQKVLGASEPMDVDNGEPNSKFKPTGLLTNGNNYDVSTCGVLHSIGSDLTRMKVTSDTNGNDSFRSELNILKAKEPGNTPTSRVDQACSYLLFNDLMELPVASRESFAAGKENGRANGNEEVDANICSKPTQEKRPRKSSAVKEPIHQNMKRLRSQVI